jgi:hypothetical protein
VHLHDALVLAEVLVALEKELVLDAVGAADGQLARPLRAACRRAGISHRPRARKQRGAGAVPACCR